jgi:hypothetical protein
LDLDQLIQEQRLGREKRHELSDWHQGLALAVICVLLAGVCLNAGERWRDTGYKLLLGALIFAAVAVLAKVRLSRLNTIQTHEVSGADGPELDGMIAALPERELLHRALQVDQDLAHSSAPRQVVLTARGTIWTALFIAVFGGGAASLAYLLFSHWGLRPLHEELLAIAVPGLFFFGMLVYSLLWVRRDHILLATGSIALAIVLGRNYRSNRRGYGYIQIGYKFRDSNGDMHDGKGADYSGSYAEGSAVAVFYNPENPKRQVPHCGSFHRVVLAHGEHREKKREFVNRLRRQ